MWRSVANAFSRSGSTILLAASWRRKKCRLLRTTASSRSSTLWPGGATRSRTAGRRPRARASRPRREGCRCRWPARRIVAHPAGYSIAAARRRNSSTTLSTARCSFGPDAREAHAEDEAAPRRGPRPLDGGRELDVGRLPAERHLHRDGRPHRRRLDVRVDAPSARAQVGQEARDALPAGEVAARRHERLNPLRLALVSGSAHEGETGGSRLTGLRDRSAPVRPRPARRC